MPDAPEPTWSPLRLRRADAVPLAAVLVAGVVLPIGFGLVVRHAHPALLWDDRRPMAYALRDFVVAGACTTLYLAAEHALAARPAWTRGLLRTVFAAALVAVFSTLQFRRFLHLGDAPHWIRHASGRVLFGSEPLGGYLHQLTYRTLVAIRGGATGEDAVRVASLAAGLLASLAVAARVRAALPRADVGAACVLLVLTPVARLYAGYPETTPFAYAATTAYLLEGLRYLERGGRRGPFAATTLLALTLVLHGGFCFVSGAQLVLLGAYLRRSDGLPWPRRGATLVACAVLPFSLLLGALAYLAAHPSLTAGLPWFGNATGGFDGHMFVTRPDAPSVPWTGWSFSYYFFEPMHRQALTNLVLSACPLALSLPFLYASGTRVRATDAFLLAAFGGFALFTCTWNADWGIAFDFDLFAAFAVPATFLVVSWLAARTTAGAQRLAAVWIAATTWAFALRPLFET